MIRDGALLFSRSSKRFVNRNGAKWLTASVTHDAATVVGRLGPLALHDASVINEHVEPVVPLLKLFRQPPDVGLHREVREH